MDVLDTNNPFSVEGDSLTLDSDLCEADSYDIPGPGLLKENGEVVSPRPQDDQPKSSPPSGAGASHQECSAPWAVP